MEGEIRVPTLEQNNHSPHGMILPLPAFSPGQPMHKINFRAKKLDLFSLLLRRPLNFTPDNM